MALAQRRRSPRPGRSDQTGGLKFGRRSSGCRHLGEGDARHGRDLRHDKSGGGMPEAAQGMVMVGVIANRRRRPIAADRRRVRIRRCRKAQGVLPETCERRDISRSNTRRRRPDEPQTERQDGECNAQRRRRGATLDYRNVAGSAGHDRFQPAGINSPIARITSRMARRQVARSSIWRRRGKPVHLGGAAAPP